MKVSLTSFLRIGFSRSIALAGGLGLVLLTTRCLGTTGRGEVSLLMVSVTLCSLLAQLVGGPSLIAASRTHAGRLLPACYLFSSAVGFTAVLFATSLGLMQPAIAMHVLLLSLLLSFTAFNQFVLLGRGKAVWANELQPLQNGLLLVVTAVFFTTNHAHTGYFIAAAYVAYVLAFGWSVFRLGTLLKPAELVYNKTVIGQLFVRGFPAQLSNLLQFMNYRLAFYAVVFYLGKSSLGVFSVSIALAESLWIIGRSIASMHVANVASGQYKGNQRRTTAKLTTQTLTLTAAGLALLLLVPAGFFTEIFGQDFRDAHGLVWYLAPGILALAAQMPLSHYYAGKGIFFYNNAAAAAGLLATLVLNLWWVPRYGLAGAALACSGAYSLSTAALWFYFFRNKND